MHEKKRSAVYDRTTRMHKTNTAMKVIEYGNDDSSMGTSNRNFESETEKS